VRADVDAGRSRDVAEARVNARGVASLVGARQRREDVLALDADRAARNRRSRTCSVIE
jgi:hypothetical protein